MEKVLLFGMNKKINDMEKQERDFKTDYCLNWTYGVEISQMKKDIEEIEKLGATHVNIEHGICYDCSYVEIDAVCRRMETYEEFEVRKKEMDSRNAEYERRELEQFKKLKEKYEK
jgi:hypothetical protein